MVKGLCRREKERERRGGRGGEEEEEEGWFDFVVSLSDVEFIFNSFISVDMYSIFFSECLERRIF